jgi:hypothetical protein
VPDPTIEAARDVLGDALGELRATLDGVSVDDLNRRPAGPSSNPLAVIAAHALSSTRSWLSLATGAPLPERDRPAEFRTVADGVSSPGRIRWPQIAGRSWPVTLPSTPPGPGPRRGARIIRTGL